MLSALRCYMRKKDNKFIYTIGDGYSDIEMIKNFNGYAMKKDSVEE